MAKDTKNKDVKNKRHFFKDFKAELKKVIWPTPKQVVNNTVAVLVIVIITALIVFVLDTCFNFINTGINGLKSKVRNNTVVVETVEQQGEESQQSEEQTGNEQQEEPSTSDEQ